MLDIRKIPELIEKLGSGVYTIKVKKGKIVIFSKTERLEGKELTRLVNKKDGN